MSQKESDDGRTVELQRFGLEVIRFKNQQIFEDVEKVVSEIKRYIEA